MAAELAPRKVALDANVLLELLFWRGRRDKVRSVLDAQESPNVQLCVSVLSIDLVMYFVEAERQSKAAAWEFLDKYMVMPMSAADAEWAYDNDAGDFEDALQISCARRSGCTDLITLDQKIEKMYGSFLTVTTIR